MRLLSILALSLLTLAGALAIDLSPNEVVAVAAATQNLNKGETKDVAIQIDGKDVIFTMKSDGEGNISLSSTAVAINGTAKVIILKDGTIVLKVISSKSADEAPQETLYVISKSGEVKTAESYAALVDKHGAEDVKNETAKDDNANGGAAGGGGIPTTVNFDSGITGNAASTNQVNNAGTQTQIATGTLE